MIECRNETANSTGLGCEFAVPGDASIVCMSPPYPIDSFIELIEFAKIVNPSCFSTARVEKQDQFVTLAGDGRKDEDAVSRCRR